MGILFVRMRFPRTITESRRMRIAILCDFMDIIGGGERVALFLGAHLHAPVFTTRLDPRLAARAGFPGVAVRSIGDVPRSPPLRQMGATLRFSRAKFDAFDRIVCVGNFSMYAAPNHAGHFWYCLTPTRMFFDQRAATLRRMSLPARPFAAAWFAVHASRERRAVARVTEIVTLSETVADRIRTYYGRDVPVLHPPVATSRFRFKEVGDFWLSVNRLYPEKRIDLQLDTFRRLPGERLKIVGGGGRVRPDDLRPPPNVEFLGEVPQEDLHELYATCRGVVATAVDEDFGLTPVEGMASGKCVLATDEGGYRETVVPGRTGFLLPPDPDALAAKVRELDDSTLLSMRDDCIARSKDFDEAVFIRRIQAMLRA